MTKQELIEQRVAQLMEIGYSVDAAQAEAEVLYKDVEDVEKSDLAPMPKVRKKKDAE